MRTDRIVRSRHTEVRPPVVTSGGRHVERDHGLDETLLGSLRVLEGQDSLSTETDRFFDGVAWSWWKIAVPLAKASPKITACPMVLDPLDFLGSPY